MLTECLITVLLIDGNILPGGPLLGVLKVLHARQNTDERDHHISDECEWMCMVLTARLDRLHGRGTCL